MRNYGICLLGTAAMRETADHRSEMVNQLLFGDIVVILESTKEWILVEALEDGYQGWVAQNQLHILADSDYLRLEQSKRFITTSMFGVVKVRSTGTGTGTNTGGVTPLEMQDDMADANKKHAAISHVESFIIGAGSTFYANCNGQMLISGLLFEYEGEQTHITSNARAMIPEYALRFLSIPYLWGGRSVFGLDCSGFTQLIYKMAGISIARDAYMQAREGETIHLIGEAEPGDLVFFDNEEELITHTGILLGKNTVIHAHGKVRIDNIDHQGIFNADIKKYSHNLRIIKRI